MGFALDFKQKYTYADYLTWPEKERWEIIDGIPYSLNEFPESMSPTPKRMHQKVLLQLAVNFSNFFRGRSCEVYVAPFDVRLATDQSDEHIVENVVQPDISIFCDSSKLDEKGAIGAPDLIVEILSPSTASKDMKTKLLLYQKFGVKEYWLVDTDQKSIECFHLDESGKYNPGVVFGLDDQFMGSLLFPKLVVDLTQVFAD